MIEDVMLRHDIEDGRARDLVRMIEAHAVQHAGAAIVTGGVEALVTERRHHLDLVLRHGAERIVFVVLAAGRLFGIAIAAQIGGDDGEFLRQPRRDFCHDRWLNGLPCISRSGGPLPPCTVTMRAPLVLISVRVKPSKNISPPSFRGVAPRQPGIDNHGPMKLCRVS